MVSLFEFLVEVLASTVRLVVFVLTEVALRDPLAFVSAAVGGLIIAGTVGFFAYLVFGAALAELGIDVGSPGRTPPREAVGDAGDGGPRTGN
jgi:uncharacterized membrane protein YraQ (UPF0718 family)